ncbi:MAG: glucose 1-dehydrogenase [Caldilineaceae bacterium SB0664_bin_27]|uniref:Glucose 1-dehydrogenase n=1 Tax=Caldilineaceae bacterium SB0664_bin_27 TaxID=2605260 RepID=A0A6B0YXZ0_9CHLR|nr:glucose 1-dehydrogenase [Caldilineaceae bacterium SB0664_bin_27]
MRLKEKVAIITGAGRGIGSTIAGRFAQEGASVVIADQDEESGRRVQAELHSAGANAIFVRTDVSSRPDVEILVDETARRFGRIDILVNNAAVLGENGHFLEISQAVWDHVVSVNQTAVFICSQLVGRVMAKAGRGNIINISSINGTVPLPRCAAYVTAKYGVESLTRIAANELAPYNIRVNTIAPGPIENRPPHLERPRLTEDTLLGRNGLPHEIAAAAVFLASEESSFITGQRIAVDGGMLVNGYRVYDVERPASPALLAEHQQDSSALGGDN